MSVRNGADTIRETIASVIAQTYQNWELLIRDNASTDETVDIIKSFNESRIRLICNENNKGLIYNHILLTEAAKGEYLKGIDDDSILYPENLEKEAAILSSDKNIVFVTCNTEYIINNTKKVKADIPFKKNIVTRKEYIDYTLLTCRGSIQEGNQSMYRTPVLQYAYDKYFSNGAYNGFINCYSGNFYILSAVLSKGDMYVIRETLSAGRIEADSDSMKYNQAKLQPAWIKLLRLDGYKINPFLYIWARIMIIIRATARRLAFKLLGGHRR
jgi:glycosyltransferase involved in cell wall biosynthesis